MTGQVEHAPFPKDEFTSLVKRLPRYGRLAWALARDPRVPRMRRAAVLAAAGYVISPIDLVPGIIPVVGQLDDVAIALAAIRVALGGLPPDVRAERLRVAALSEAELDGDLRTTAVVAAWLARRSVRVGTDVARQAAETGARISRKLLRSARH